jgi:hypothetical protein
MVSLTILMGLALSACAPVPRQPAPLPAPVPTPVPPPQEEPETEEPENPETGMAALAALLPEREGFRWVYYGFAEYGHEMTLDSITTEDGQRVYEISGEVFDMSDGESDRDFILALRYTLSNGVLVQEKNEDVMLDSDFDRIELIRGPLQEGTRWQQNVVNGAGRAYILNCEITQAGEEDGAALYMVVYQEQNGPYFERRVFKEGIGVILFEKLLQMEEGDFEVSYHLYEEGSGYPEGA